MSTQTTATDFVTVDGDYYCYDYDKKGKGGIKDFGISALGLETTCVSSRGKRAILEGPDGEEHEVEAIRQKIKPSMPTVKMERLTPAEATKLVSLECILRC